MLNRTSLITQLSQASGAIFFDVTDELTVLHKAWGCIAQDTLYINTVRAATHVPWILPTWSGLLGDTTRVTPMQEPYHVIAIDGSQVYPDRHQGTACALVNIGTVQLCYKGAHKGAQLNSIPYVIADGQNNGGEPVEYINGIRQERELQAGLELMRAVCSEKLSEHVLLLIDGSLIFWHLQAKEGALWEQFLDHYIAILESLYLQRLPIMSYISLPGSKELVNLVRLHLSATAQADQIDHLFDTHVAELFLKPFEVTTVFAHHSPVIDKYPAHLKPYFRYMHAGNEIVRIEFPAWMAYDEGCMRTAMQIVVDQINKGSGYPVSLSESHEQAVVKGPDREFFYQMIYRLGAQHKQHVRTSYKSLKKRVVSI